VAPRDNRPDAKPALRVTLDQGRRGAKVTTLSSLVRTYVDQRLEGPALLQVFARNVQAAARRYPDAYFEMGRRTPEALSSLVDRVFTACERVPKGRFPFLGRVPFRAYLDERHDDPTIRYHSFYARLSITREILRDDYAFNLRRDPALRWRRDLHRAIGACLAASCERVDQGPRALPVWRVSRGPAIVRSPGDVQDRLRPRAARGEALEVLVPDALALAGEPLSHARLTNLLADVLPDPSAAATTLPDEPDADPERVRDAVLRAWEELEPGDRELLGALARGASYDDLIARVPSFRNRTAVSRAVSRCGVGFVARVVAEVGGEPDPQATPRALLETILEVLLPLLPEPRPQGAA
jgi:hypothetical protein